jgi:hypothetical protein
MIQHGQTIDTIMYQVSPGWTNNRRQISMEDGLKMNVLEMVFTGCHHQEIDMKNKILKCYGWIKKITLGDQT